MKKITKLSECVAGNLYCLVKTIKPVDTTEEYDSFGALAWYCSDGNLYESDDNPTEARDITHWDWDYLVEQVGCKTEFFA